ncbi:unnamed protein product [Tilletia controversa]|nr:unnamed protein product [Tilletia caries]CAD6917533.1 unnamed protein product [Tilletia controversa]CAD6965199.1 unnamed protein product [Tilletia laevis]CAD6907880.1 unnamed protein product [Tilletia caries]CAD6939251.1 unnamed protein product [Tilletia controversa]
MFAYSPMFNEHHFGPFVEEEDELHNPADADAHSNSIALGGALNIAVLVIITAGLLGLFAGYPIVAYLSDLQVHRSSLHFGFNVGGTNGTGQIPDLNIRQILDPETPKDAFTFVSTGVDKSLQPSNRKFKLVFSDEFNEEGRTFWKGDDPFWEAVDIWYGATLDYEWYSPEAINTTGGHLVIMLEELPNHNLNFRSGMLQSWNKLCYQGGYIEFSMLQPGSRLTQGYWPALWMMGNLGRPGYLGSTEGLWPYSYNGCDTGIMPKQLAWNESSPKATIEGLGRFSKPSPDNPDGPIELSHLPGMRFPSCTCPGEDHPGPNVNVGRSAPELDAIEAQIQYHSGVHSYASQSLQTAPFDAGYFWHNQTDVDYHIYDRAVTRINDYVGGTLQECTSGLTQVPDDGYEGHGQRFVTYGVEYQPDWSGDGKDAYVTFFLDGKPTWTVFGSALGPRPDLDVSQRLIPVEPMSIIANLGMATGFQPVHFEGPYAMTFPASMKIDYVRLYQLEGKNALIGCDPPDHPTLNYINKHPDLYYNHDYLKFNQSQHKWPRNKMTTGC